MKKRFVVRPVRQLDLDRIEVIEAASFGADAYERNLFAEYTRICGALFLVAQVGTKVIGYSITALPARWPGSGPNWSPSRWTRRTSAKGRRRPCWKALSGVCGAAM